MSRRMSAVMLLVICAFTFWGCASDATGKQETAPAGAWDLKGVDAAGTTWVATLVLTHQEGGLLRGHVDWVGDNSASGREYVSGSFDARAGVVEFAGESVEYDDRIVRCEYHAFVSADGARLERGSWTHKDVTVPGSWEATRIGPWAAQPADASDAASQRR